MAFFFGRSRKGCRPFFWLLSPLSCLPCLSLRVAYPSSTRLLRCMPHNETFSGGFTMTHPKIAATPGYSLRAAPDTTAAPTEPPRQQQQQQQQQQRPRRQQNLPNQPPQALPFSARPAETRARVSPQTHQGAASPSKTPAPKTPAYGADLESGFARRKKKRARKGWSTSSGKKRGKRSTGGQQTNEYERLIDLRMGRRIRVKVNLQGHPLALEDAGVGDTDDDGSGDVETEDDAEREKENVRHRRGCGGSRTWRWEQGRGRTTEAIPYCSCLLQCSHHLCWPTFLRIVLRTSLAGAS